MRGRTEAEDVVDQMLEPGSDPARFVVEPERYTGPEVVPPRVVKLEVRSPATCPHGHLVTDPAGGRSLPLRCPSGAGC